MDQREHPPLVVVVGGEETRSLVAGALGEQEMRLEWLEGADGLSASIGSPPDAVLVDADLVAGPEEVSSWIESGWLRSAVPLLLIVRARPDSARLQEWLRAGVWDLVPLPVDSELLGLRLRNLLGNRRQPLPGRTWIVPAGPYSWTTLVRAADESLALGRRYDRPVSCIAISVHDMAADSPDDADRLLRRLGIAAREWVRGSDLVGLSESGAILVVLTDTPIDEAKVITPRLVTTLERSLQQWSVVARLDAATSSPGPDQSATEFLLQAARSTF